MSGEVGTVPVRFVESAEAAFHAVGVVTAGVHPQDDRRAGVNEMAGDDDFIAAARFKGARTRRRVAAAGQGKGKAQNRQLQ